MGAADDILGSAPDISAAPPAAGASSDILRDDAPDVRLTTAVSEGRKQNPDEAAKVFDLQAKTGLDADLIARNTQLVDRSFQDKMFDAGSFIENAKKSAAWLDAPHKAAVASDALPAMQKLEQTVEDHGWLSNVGASFMKGAAGAVGGVGLIPNLVNTMRLAGGTSAPPEYEAGLAASLRDNAVVSSSESAKAYWDNPGLQAENAKKVADLWATDKAAALRKLSYGVTEGLPTMMLLIGSAGTSALLGEGAVAGLATGHAAESADQATQAGLAPAAAATVGAVKGGIFAAGSLLGALSPLRAYEEALVHSLGKPVGQAAFRSMLTDVVKNYAGTISSGAFAGAGMAGGDALTDYVSGANPHALDNIGAQLMEAAAVGGLTNVAISPLTIGAGLHARSEEIHQADLNKGLLTELEKQFADSPLTKRSPAAAADHLAAVLQGSHVQDAYSPAADFKTFFQDQNLDPLKAASDLGVGPEYIEAEKSGADFKIPTAKIIEKMSGTPQFKQFVDHLKFDPAQATPAQAKELTKQAGEQDAAAQPVVDGATRVGELIKGQMLESGASAGEAETTAKVWEERYRIRAQRRGEPGMGPRELLQAWPVTITREGKPIQLDLAKEDPRQVLGQAWSTFTHQDALPFNYVDPVTQTLNERAFNAMPAPEGKGLVAHISVEGVKHANDKLGGHGAGDAVYQMVGQALMGAAPLVSKVKGDFLLRVADQAELDKVLQAANEALPEAVQIGDKTVSGKAFRLSGALGSTAAEALAAHTELKAGLEAKGQRSVRGAAPAGLAAPAGAIGEKPSTLTAAIPEELRAAHGQLKPGQVFEAVNIDKPSGMLSDEGFRQLPPKAFRASIDLNWLKHINTALGEGAGDSYLRAFEKEAQLFAKEEGLQLDFAHKSGDEYLAQSNDGERMKKFFVDLEHRLRQANVVLVDGEGKEFVQPSITFGVGIGGSDGIAEQQLKVAKDRQAGRRTAESFAAGVRSLVPGERVGQGEERRVTLDQRSGVAADLETVAPVDLNDPRVREQNRQIEMAGIAEAGGVSPVTDEIARLKRRGVTKPSRVLESLVESGVMPAGSFEDDVAAAVQSESIAKEKFIQKYGGGSREAGVKELARMQARKRSSQAYLSLDQARRAAFSVSPEERFITLMKKSNPSSILHESWHGFYFELAQDADYVRGLDPATLTSEQAGLVTDMDTALKAVGAESFESMTRAQHEKLAKWGEQYMRDGKAPSAELQPVFDKFRSWLIAVYRNVKSLLGTDTGYNEEIRGVMDRMLASDDAITAAQTKQGLEPLPGLTEPKYLAAVAAAHESALTTLSEKVLAQWHRQRKAEWKAERDKVFADRLADVNKRPEYVVLNALQKGVDSEGKPLPEAIKLDKAATLAAFSEEQVKALPKDIFAAGDEPRVPPDMMAAHFGFKSADEMLTLITGKPRPEAVAGDQADAWMEMEHGNLLTDGKMPDEALQAVHNEKRAQMLRMELEHLAENNLTSLKGIIRKVVRRPPPIEAARAAAEETIGGRMSGDIRPSLYLSAENKQRRSAGDLLTKGDVAGAFDAKQKELLNHELYRSATEARDNVAKVSRYMKKFDKVSTSKRIGKAGEELIGSIDYIRGQYGYGDALGAEGRAHLESLMAKQEKAGNPMIFADSVLSDAAPKSSKFTPYDELVNAYSAVKMIEHVATEKNKLLTAEKEATLEDKQRDLKASVTAIHGEGKGVDQGAAHDYDPGVMAKIAEARRKGVAWMMRPLFIIGEVDGHQANGVAYKMLWEPKQRAEAAEAARQRTFREEEKTTLYGHYSREEKAMLFLRKIAVPEIKQSLTKERMLMILANMGNEENLKALSEGNKYSPEQLQAIVSNLEPRDLDTVRAMWKHVDSYWPDVKAQEFKLRGIAPEKVKATPFEVTLKDGSVHQMEGGYFPIMFDRERSPRKVDPSDIKSVGEMFGGDYARWMTKDGHTHERVGAGGAALRLGLDDFTRHVSSVIHDLSYRETLIDLHKLVNDPSIKEDVSKAVGKEKWGELNPWITRMAGSKEYDPMDSVAGWLRTNLTSSILAWRISVGLKHAGSEFITMHELGPEYAVKGLVQMMNLPKIQENMELMYQLEPYMRNRDDAGDRDMHDFIRGRGVLNKPGLMARLAENVIGGKVGSKAALVDAWKKEVELSYFVAVRQIDKMVSFATWNGTYAKAMDGKIPGIAAGDQKAAVSHASRQVQEIKGAGGPGDLPRILTGGDWQHLFTMFMTQRNVIFNQHAKSIQKGGVDIAKGAWKVASGSLLSAMMLKWMVPAIWNTLVTKGVPKGDEEKAHAAMEAAAFPAEGVPFAQEAIRYAFQKYEGQRDPHISLPALNFVEESVTSGPGLYAASFGDGMSHQEARAAADVAGALFRLPGPLMFQFLDYTNDWLNGDQQPDSAQEAMWRALVAGKER